MSGIDVHISLGQVVMALVGALLSGVGSLLAWSLKRLYGRFDDFMEQWDYIVVTSGASYRVVSTKFPLETGEAVTHIMRKRGQTAKAANGQI